jgi:hypothetical protein
MKKKGPSYIDVDSITDLHTLVQYSPPRHPLVSVIDHEDFYAKRPKTDGLYRFGFYTISCKKFEGLLYYGKGQYDFREGSLMFTAPGQVIGAGPDIHVDEGWALFFHSDLLHGTSLGKKMHEYSFFHYEVNEALHISEEEAGKSTLEHIHLELVERAKSLLWGTDHSISEIAYELGFEYPSHFTKIFKAKTGKSPSEYRTLN